MKTRRKSAAAAVVAPPPPADDDENDDENKEGLEIDFPDDLDLSLLPSSFTTEGKVTPEDVIQLVRELVDTKRDLEERSEEVERKDVELERVVQDSTSAQTLLQSELSALQTSFASAQSTVLSLRKELEETKMAKEEEGDKEKRDLVRVLGRLRADGKEREADLGRLRVSNEELARDLAEKEKEARERGSELDSIKVNFILFFVKRKIHVANWTLLVEI